MALISLKKFFGSTQKFTWIILIFALSLASCNSNTKPFDPSAQAKADEAIIKTYLKAHPEIKATRDTSGFYYQVINPGTGAAATTTSTVTVNYTGTFLDGSVFDKSSTPYTNSLQSLVPGWGVGIPLIKQGGKILLILPSALGYGSSGAGAIPANTVLVFTIELLSVR